VRHRHPSWGVDAGDPGRPRRIRAHAYQGPDRRRPRAGQRARRPVRTAAQAFPPSAPRRRSSDWMPVTPLWMLPAPSESTGPPCIGCERRWLSSPTSHRPGPVRVARPRRNPASLSSSGRGPRQGKENYRPWSLGFLGKMPKIFPVASIKRKVSGSCPGWRRATSCARNLAAAIASAAVAKTEVS
jgi:hypothetical protein